MLTTEVLRAHKQRLLKNHKTALHMLQTVEGALALVESLIVESEQPPSESPQPKE